MSRYTAPHTATADRGPRNSPVNLLTVQEVADTLKVSESTVRRLIKSGVLVAYRVGDRGQLRIESKDLEAYVQGQRVSTQRTEASPPSSEEQA